MYPRRGPWTRRPRTRLSPAAALIAVFPLALASSSALADSPPSVAAADSGDTPLYGPFELSLSLPEVPGNKFRIFASVTFSKDARSFEVDGFHDGNDTWIARFMPDEEGDWNYSWELQGHSGDGSFTCTPKSNPKSHGHVRLDPANPRYLIHDDGTPHYFYGSKWIAATNYGPPTKGSEPNPERYTDQVFLDFVDTLEQLDINGLLLKTALFPLENDQFSWDLEWIRRGEWMVREMAARGIYCQINLFDTWSRDKDKVFDYNTSGSQQVFDVWNSGSEDAKENYLRTLVARFAGFYNVSWEVGNEMEHAPNSGSGFVTQANQNYIPWIRQYDPYDLPIGLSESVWNSSNVDIGFLHQTDSLPGTTTNGNRPVIMNELVGGGDTGPLWSDNVARDPASRLSYRRTFWRMFTRGGAGSSAATWLRLENEPPNEAALETLRDQQRLRGFVEAIPASINEMDYVTSGLSSAPGEATLRCKPGVCYAAYFLGNQGQNFSAGSLGLDLPAGDFELRWYHPSLGTWSPTTEITSTGGAQTLSHPAFTEDLALLVALDSPSATLPTINVEVEDAYASEHGPDSGAFLVSRTPTEELDQPLVVRYSTAGTAVEGDDYEALPGWVLIPRNSLSATVEITPLPDAGFESDKTATLVLEVDSEYNLGASAQSSITFSDRPFDAWLALNFSAAQRNNPKISGKLADPDKDGIDNLMEYALGLNPLQHDPDGMPHTSVADSDLFLTYTRVKDAVDVAYNVFVSSDLNVWNTGPSFIEEAEVIDQGDTERVTVKALNPQSGKKNRFIHLQVSLTE